MAIIPVWAFVGKDNTGTTTEPQYGYTEYSKLSHVLCLPRIPDLTASISFWQSPSRSVRVRRWLGLSENAMCRIYKCKGG